METLKEKLGPFPVYVWLLILTAAGVGWWLLSRKKGGKAQPTPVEAANDVPQTVIQVSDSDSDEDKDTDRERKRKKKATAHKCPHGYHFEPVSKGSEIWPLGGKRVAGGFCVPDHKHRRTPVDVEMIPNPRVPRAGAGPMNHEPAA